MDTLIKDLITMGGPLGVLVVVVWIFVKDRHTESVEHRSWMESLTRTSLESMRMLHDDHIAARKEAMVCMNKNTDAMLANTSAMGAVAEAVRQCPNRKAT
jgi:hypothetical protein